MAAPGKCDELHESAPELHGRGLECCLHDIHIVCAAPTKRLLIGMPLR